MRFFWVFALTLAIVSVSSGFFTGRKPRNCNYCNRMKKLAEGSQHRRLFLHIFIKYFCKGCDPVQVEDKCTPDPCKNDGECQSEDGSCICPPEFSGPTCEEQVQVQCLSHGEASCVSDCSFGTTLDMFCENNKVCCTI